MINERHLYKKQKSMENIKATEENSSAFSIEELQTQILTLKGELEAATRPSSGDVMGENNYIFYIIIMI